MIEQPKPARESWVVLLVDDEPEVHEVTRLVLSNAHYAGRPIELYSASSAAEAKNFLRAHPQTALVLLDVVMESDDAGLALVRFIRDELHNADLQIVVRTGQPGMAPERDVVLRFEVNGYFLKTEITAQKLHSIVISALRAFRNIGALRRPRPAAAASAERDLRQDALAAGFARAIEQGELHLLAQPEVALASNAIVGIEMLPTWKSGEGILGLSQIASAVRDPELRLRFDEWLLRQAGAWARSWRALHPSLRISLPMLTASVWDCEVLSVIDRCLGESAPFAGAIDLEVPESALLHEHAGTREGLAFLQAREVTVTVVDFGSGMVSLPVLRRLRPDRVKIHSSFVRNVAADAERSAVARSIIALAHTLGAGVVASGIASESDLQFFKWEGCDVGQGDLLARSVALADVAALLSAKASATH
ncbi:MAG: EAL domain-containing response regulator [Burkholderiales bacterium]|nr:EAL domain-containing response regulator [Burkholderiales bacterium]MCE7877411.1 EAL domain-containing protein [Betaproteobacteria bacterium PRO3]